MLGVGFEAFGEILEIQDPFSEHHLLVGIHRHISASPYGHQKQSRDEKEDPHFGLRYQMGQFKGKSFDAWLSAGQLHSDFLKHSKLIWQFACRRSNTVSRKQSFQFDGLNQKLFLHRSLSLTPYRSFAKFEMRTKQLALLWSARHWAS